LALANPGSPENSHQIGGGVINMLLLGHLQRRLYNETQLLFLATHFHVRSIGLFTGFERMLWENG